MGTAPQYKSKRNGGSKLPHRTLHKMILNRSTLHRAASRCRGGVPQEDKNKNKKQYNP